MRDMPVGASLLLLRRDAWWEKWKIWVPKSWRVRLYSLSRASVSHLGEGKMSHACCPWIRDRAESLSGKSRGKHACCSFFSALSRDCSPSGLNVTNWIHSSRGCLINKLVRWWPKMYTMNCYWSSSKLVKNRTLKRFMHIKFPVILR